MSSIHLLPGIAFAMRYPDDVGLVWASMARFHSGAVAELKGVARAFICFPVLTDRPAFQTPWATRIACDWYDTYSLESRERIRATVREQGIQVVIYIACLAYTLDLRFLRGLGLRTVSVEVDSYPTNNRQSWLKWAAKKIIRGWLCIGVHNRYIANAHHQRRYLLDFAGLPPNRVETVVNGVDLELFTPNPRPDPATLDLPPTEYYVLSVSQARPEKRVDVLVDAAAQVFRIRPELSLTFVHVGGGQCLDEWKARAAQHGLADRFRFPGNKAVVAPFHRLATVFVHPAERESFGYAVVEAMASGKPVIAARSSGPAEIVEAGVTGIIVEPGDVSGMAREILALLDDPPRRERMGTAGRQRADRLYNYRRQGVELARVIRGQLVGAR
jgi:glycosyltransferase involved in cell wall biosynthesis